jgi:endonuclease/exonuclease/phosphatase family metal-dependent hydrolase
MQSTHFDHQGEVARKKSAELILFEIQKERALYPFIPIFLLGDLNSPETDDAYQILGAGMSDLREINSAKWGHTNTFTGFDGRDLKRIDYIFGSLGGGWRVGGYGVEENRFDDGVWLSDHRLVVADVLV